MFPLLLSLSAASALEITHTPRADDHRVLLSAAAEPFATTTLGYQHGLSVGGRAVGLSASLTAPVFLLDGRHHRLEVAGRTVVARWRDLGIDARVGLFEQSTSSALVRGTALGTRTSALAGWFPRRGFLSTELSLAWSPTAHLRPTDHYDELWGGMASGWYGNPAAGLTLGLQGGLVIADRVELATRLAVDRTLGGGGRIAPLYAGLGGNLWW